MALCTSLKRQSFLETHTELKLWATYVQLLLLSDSDDPSDQLLQSRPMEVSNDDDMSQHVQVERPHARRLGVLAASATNTSGKLQQAIMSN